MRSFTVRFVVKLGTISKMELDVRDVIFLFEVGMLFINLLNEFLPSLNNIKRLNGRDATVKRSLKFYSLQ